MSADPFVLIPEVHRATQRLLRTVDLLDAPALTGRSLLPGWSRGHVLAHLARQADSFVRLLDSARSGDDVPQYTSDAVRDAEIAAGAARPLAEHRADLVRSAERLATAFETLPPGAWGAFVVARGGNRVAAAQLVWSRLREVEIHHVDLDAGYRPEDWDTAFTLRLLHDRQAGLRRTAAARLIAFDLEREFHIGTIDNHAPTVRGPGCALAAWLIGRSDGSDLSVQPDGPLPVLPAWK